MRCNLACCAVMGIVACCAAPAWADDPAATSSALTADELRQGVTEALRQWPAAAIPDDAGVRRLVQLYQQLSDDTSLPSDERRRRSEVVGRRLAHFHRSLQGGTPQPPALPRFPVEQQQILAQFGGFGTTPQQPTQGVGAPRGVPDNGEELVKLIESVIAPTQWDTVGGGNAIRYWKPWRVLVIYADGETHGQLGGVLGDLRK